MSAPLPTPEPRRWKLQFSLRTLMLLVLVIAVFMAWFRHNLDAANRQRRILQTLCEKHQLAVDTRKSGFVHFCYADQPRVRHDSLDDHPGGGWAPQWLVKKLSHDFFSRVNSIFISASLIDDIMELNGLDDVIIQIENNPISDRDIEALAGLPNLRTLMLLDQTQRGFDDNTLAAIGERLDLTKINLCNSRKVITGGLAALGKLKNLREFMAQSIPVDDDLASVVAQWTKLETLVVNGQHVSLTRAGVRKLCELPTANRWKRLSLNIDELGDEILAHADRVPNLEFITLRGPVTANNAANLAKLKRLTEIEFIGGSVDNEMARMLAMFISHVRKISLFETLITDAGVEQFAQLPGIEELEVRRSLFTKNGIAAIQAAYPKVKIVGFDPTSPPTSSAKDATTPNARPAGKMATDAK